MSSYGGHNIINPNQEQHEHLVLPRLGYLQTLEGSVQQLLQLVENDAYCIDIIQHVQQLKAALALERFNVRMLSDHLNGIRHTAIQMVRKQLSASACSVNYCRSLPLPTPCN